MPSYKGIPGVHIQWPWSRFLLEGKKRIETRSYPLPQKYIGKTLAMIETPGPKGKTSGITESRIVGTIKFSNCFQYKNKKQWISDFSKHLVPEEHPQFSFSDSKEKWAWVVEEVKMFSPPKPAPKKRGIVFATACEV